MADKSFADRPLKYCIYKGMGGKQGAFQFSLKKSYVDTDKNERIEGAVFVEAAPTTGPNVYDWDNKIIFALSHMDIAKVIVGFRDKKFDIFHDPDAQTDKRGTRSKTLSLEAGQQDGTFFLRLSEKNPSASKFVSISLSKSEALELIALLNAALPLTLGWM